MSEYLKINSLYKRDKETNKLIVGDYSCEEFESVDRWMVTEKIDGTNVRVMYQRKDGISQLRFGGRTDAAQIPTDLLAYLQDTFNIYMFQERFPDAQTVTLYGEGYGGKIQSGGWYCKTPEFVLFDVKIGHWWLEVPNVAQVALQLGIKSVPILASGHEDSVIWTKQEIVDYVKRGPLSLLARESQKAMEGVVARSYPQMFTRMRGEPVMFKLKYKDMKEVENG